MPYNIIISKFPQSLLTWAALHRVVASRYWRIRYESSTGKTAKKSIRIRALMEVDKYDNCEKQHFANIPSIKILRSFPGTFEKRVQVEAIASWELRERLSSSGCTSCINASFASL